jgi:hypothetical protein
LDILASGGFTVSFDWTPAIVTENRGISFQVGTDNTDTGYLTNDDSGILFRQNGETQRFNGSLIASVLMEQSDEWENGHAYLNATHLS